MVSKTIDILGARTHNLKNITCHIPHRQLTVITGPSGSGKSSLAFDTLYAEGQRRFLVSVSAYVRQFLERLDKPDVDDINHILPAIALEQKNRIRNARSTVGSATEMVDYLRLLFVALGQVTCSICGPAAVYPTPQAMAGVIQAWPSGTKLMVLAPVSTAMVSPEQLVPLGLFRVWHEGALHELTAKSTWAEFGKPQTMRLVVDRLVVEERLTEERLCESLQKALELNDAEVQVVRLDQPQDPITFLTRFRCPHAEGPFPEVTPAFLSFNSPIGACPTCEGFGKIIGLDLDKVIPNKSLSLEAGAIHPFSTPANADLQAAMVAACQAKGIPTDVPYMDLTEAQKRVVLEGNKDFEGVYPFFEWLETKKYKVHVRVMLAKYRGYYPCPTCHGSRLRPQALQVRLLDKSIDDCCQMPIRDLKPFLETVDTTLEPAQRQLTQRIRRELQSRTQYMIDVGLGYLTLSRQARTLSGGESQRIHLSSALGSALTETLYVLDEPTVGLHAVDTHRLMTVLNALKQLGNTVVVVEHDPEVMALADYIIDLGPGGGHLGGHVVFAGPGSALSSATDSITAQHLFDIDTRQATPLPASTGEMTLVNARGHNLKQLTVTLPKQQLVCLTGVSGSGKSSLLHQTLYANYQQLQGRELTLEALPVDELVGFDTFEDVVMVDQSPLGQSKRSNPVTYVKAYDDIRQRFAKTRQAQAMGITASHFSFNSDQGRCATCHGLGEVVIDMQFLADVSVTCPDCRGQRFLPSVLGVTYQGKTITDVLSLTIEEALAFFADDTALKNKLKPLVDIGLGYLSLGQSTSTLSGGEAQRLKLASYLAESSSRKGTTKRGATLFLFDEPTTGLHLADIGRLVHVMRQLVAVGHSVVVIEHHLDFIRQADYVVDLGPGGGDEGGQIVAQGSISEFINHPTSVTAACVRAGMGHRQQVGQGTAAKSSPKKALATQPKTRAKTKKL